MFCLCLARVEFLLVSSVTLTLTVSAGEPPLTLGLWESSRSSTLESRTFQRLLLASPDQASLLEPAAMSLFTLLMADDVNLQLPLRLSVADFILDLADLSISTNLASCRGFPSPSLTVSTWMSSSVAGLTLFLVVSL